MTLGILAVLQVLRAAFTELFTSTDSGIPTVKRGSCILVCKFGRHQITFWLQKAHVYSLKTRCMPSKTPLMIRINQSLLRRPA